MNYFENSLPYLFYEVLYILLSRYKATSVNINNKKISFPDMILQRLRFHNLYEKG